MLSHGAFETKSYSFWFQMQERFCGRLKVFAWQAGAPEAYGLALSEKRVLLSDRTYSACARAIRTSKPIVALARAWREAAVLGMTTERSRRIAA